MNTDRIDVNANNENLRPRKRRRTRPIEVTESVIGCKAVVSEIELKKQKKLDIIYGRSAFTEGELQEMGVVTLESEESSSSVASTLLLAISSSNDENSNSNESTPLDAPRFKVQHVPGTYRCGLNYLDVSTNSAASNSFIDPNETLKAPTQRHKLLSHNNNMIEQQIDEMEKDKLSKSQLKALGAYASVNSTTSASETNSAKSLRSHSRSPLTAVPCNTNLTSPRSLNALQTQQSQLLNSTLPNQGALGGGDESGMLSGIISEGSSHVITVNAFSPSLLPSTSQAAALLRQQHQQQLQELQRELLQQEQQPQQRQIQHRQLQQSQQKQQSSAIQAEPNNPSPDVPICNDTFFRLHNQLKRNQRSTSGPNYFELMSDEMVLNIFKWLPKKTLFRCSLVSQRFRCLAQDESLWSRLDLSGRSLRSGAMEEILSRGVVILRMAQTTLREPLFPESSQLEPNFESKLQYLDLSMACLSKRALKVLLSTCRNLKKLSLEHVPVNDDVCNEIAKNKGLEAINFTMSCGLEAWSVRKMMTSLQNLTSLNISWTGLTPDAITAVVTHVSPNLMRLNLAGCRKTLFDSHVETLSKRCPQLLELDLSDCTGLTNNAVKFICNFKMLEYLSLSRCYLITAPSYVDLCSIPTLAYFDVFGMLSDNVLELLENEYPMMGINKFVHSSVARPTVGTRRTSIWGLRTRD